MNSYESKAHIQGLPSTPDSYALTRHNVLSKACMVRVRLYARRTRDFFLSHIVCLPYASLSPFYLSTLKPR